MNPDLIQLNTLDRPGTVQGLRGATIVKLERIAKFWDIDNVEIIASAYERKKFQSYRNDIASTILETIARRPCTLDDLSKILRIHITEINKYLDVLEFEDKIETVELDRVVFYQINEKYEN